MDSRGRRVVFELRDETGKDFEIAIDLEGVAPERTLFGVRLKDNEDEDGKGVFIVKIKPEGLFYRKLQEYEATLPPGEVMFSPYRVKSLTIMDGQQEVFKSSGPAGDMLGALRSAVPTPKMSATGVNFVASPPAATEG